MPSSTVLNFTDPFAYQSAFRSVDVELFPTVKGEFRAELTQVSLSKLWVHGAHEDLPRVYIGMVKPHRAAIGFLTRPNQPAMLHCGMTVSPGEIVINDTDLMYRRTSANCDWGSMSLPKDDFDAIYQAVTGHEYAGSSLKHIVRPASELMSRLLNIHELVGHLAKTTPDILSLPEVARVLEPYRLLFLEEPTIPEDPDGYARIRKGTSTTIAGSERLTSKFRFHDFFRAGAVDVAQPDIVYIGGITEMKKVAAIAELYQVVIAPHNTKGPVGIMAAAHVMGAIPNPLIQEFITPTWIPWRNAVLREGLQVEDGKLIVRDRPGLGVEFDDAVLAEHVIV